MNQDTYTMQQFENIIDGSALRLASLEPGVIQTVAVAAVDNKFTSHVNGYTDVENNT